MELVSNDLGTEAWSISLCGEGVGWPCCRAEPLGEVHLQIFLQRDVRISWEDLRASATTAEHPSGSACTHLRGPKEATSCLALLLVGGWLKA